MARLQLLYSSTDVEPVVVIARPADKAKTKWPSGITWDETKKGSFTVRGEGEEHSLRFDVDVAANTCTMTCSDPGCAKVFKGAVFSGYHAANHLWAPKHRPPPEPAPAPAAATVPATLRLDPTAEQRFQSAVACGGQICSDRLHVNV